MRWPGISAARARTMYISSRAWWLFFRRLRGVSSRVTFSKPWRVVLMSPRDDTFDDLVGFNEFDDLVGFDDLIEKGDSLLSWGSYTAAIAKFNEALRLDPESALALHKRGQ